MSEDNPAPAQQGSSLIAELQEALSTEQEAVAALRDSLPNICRVVELLREDQGKVVFTGVGKSGALARRIASSFVSIGRDSHFIHAYEAMHGDMGFVCGDDILIAFSHSGETREVIEFVNLATARGSRVVVVTSAPQSPLAEIAALTVPYPAVESCQFDFVPTASLTSMTVIFNLVLVGLCTDNSITAEHLARNHPNGTLGLKFARTVADYIRTDVPKVPPTGTLMDVLLAIDKGEYGMCFVSDGSGANGIITSGDIRRALKESDIQNVTAAALVNEQPSTVVPELSAFDARVKMRDRNLAFLVVSEEDRFKGVVRAIDIV